MTISSNSNPNVKISKSIFYESVSVKILSKEFSTNSNDLVLYRYITNHIASESENNKEGFFKKIWNAIKKFFQWIGTFFNNTWRRIKIFIKKLIRKFRRRKKDKDVKQTVVSTNPKPTQPTEPPKEMKHYTKKRVER